jgi:cell division initiation protein
MPLTPKDIEQKTFTASFRGYAEDEVDVFLEEVIVSISEYQQMVRERDAVLAGQPGGHATAPIGDAAAANAEANRILQAARRQAEQILADARAEAGLVQASAAPAPGLLTPEQEAERQRLLAGYERLRDELSAVRARVRKALAASDEAFGIVEGQVEGIIDEATPRAVGAAPPAVEAPAAAQEELTGDVPPRRPWEQ